VHDVAQREEDTPCREAVASETYGDGIAVNALTPQAAIASRSAITLRRRLRWCLALLISSTILAIPTRPPAAAADSRAAPAPSYYLALGDSLASGVGAGPGAGYVDDLLASYRRAVPALQLVNLGCPGETTDSMINGGCQASGSQLSAAEAFLNGHGGQVAVVTIDIGGNDVASCASSGSVDVNCFASSAGTVVTNLRTILSRLRRAGGPTTPVLGMNYFDPFLVYWLQPSTRSIATQTAQYDHIFSGMLGQAYGTANVPVADVEAAFASQDFDHTVTRPYGTVPVNVANACDWLTMTCGPNGFTGGIDVHANATGYRVVARAFEAVTPALVPGVTPPARPPLAATGRDLRALSAVGVAAIALGLLMLSSRRTHRRALIVDPPGGS
jgi:lysophospholipase L1-like esterase